jgi:cytoskeletal protein CcmA (bactofilin family)
MPLQISGYGEQDAPMVGKAASLSSPQSSTPAFKDAPRVVVCFECEATHKVAAASTSTICPRCSTYLDLRDLDIKDRTNQRIRTRGNVTVQKKGALLGTSVHCGNLTVHGAVSGSIYAAGEVHLKMDGKIIGEIRCQKFILDKKCEVHCLQPVYAEVVEIHGHVTGHFHATKCISLSRHASLTGSATARTMSVERGAILNGQVQVPPVDHTAPAQLTAALAAG